MSKMKLNKDQKEWVSSSAAGVVLGIALAWALIALGAKFSQENAILNAEHMKIKKEIQDIKTRYITGDRSHFISDRVHLYDLEYKQHVLSGPKGTLEYNQLKKQILKEYKQKTK